jgi:broad specificity phosphatase PhoE
MRRWIILLGALLTLLLSGCGSAGTARSGSGISVEAAIPVGSASSVSSSAGEGKSVVFFLVRHGQTESNVAQRLQGGRSDSPLTEEGENTATALGEALSEVHFDAAYSSELGRAIRTEQIILDANRKGSAAAPTPDPAFNDIDWGDAEDLPRADVEAKYGPLDEDTYLGAADDASAVAITGGESKYQFCERFGIGVDSILDTYKEKGGVILLTAHSSAAYYLQKLFPEQELGGLQNASVTIWRETDAGRELLDFDDTDYGSLPERLREWGFTS